MKVNKLYESTQGGGGPNFTGEFNSSDFNYQKETVISSFYNQLR